MRKLLLFSGLLLSLHTIAQTDSRSQIKAELTDWDPVRGEWLEESINAMANNQPIPDRTFPEDLTPDEMYNMIPSDRQDRIRQIASRPTREQPRVEPSTSSNRVPVGANPRNPQSNSNDRYNNFFSNASCQLVMGRSYGDPHIRTFDNKSYSFQTVGEYILASSPDNSFHVQTRQKPETNSVSLNTAVAMNVYGDRVGIYASDIPDGNTSAPLRVNGRPVYLNNETFYLPHGGTIENNGREYVVTWPTGEKVQAKLASSSGLKFMNLSVFVKECRGDYYGLLGNANGRSDDDFMGSNPRANLATSTIFDPFDSRDFNRANSAMEREHLAFLARDFGNQFLVTDQTSLFEYGFGQSSWSFHDPSFPRTHITMGDISRADRDRARRECERQGIFGDDMNACVMDFAHANIPPTPRPSTPSRVGNGRSMEPVRTRQPNVNRTDVFERPPRGGNQDSGIRIPSTDNGQTGGGRTDIPTSSTPTRAEGGKVDVKESTIAPARTEERTNTSERTVGSAGAVKPAETTTRRPVEDSKTSSKPSGQAAEQNRTVSPSNRSEDKPASRPASTTSSPATRPASGGTTRTNEREQSVKKPSREPAKSDAVSPSRKGTDTPSAQPARSSGVSNSSSRNSGASRSGTSSSGASRSGGGSVRGGR